jgi:uncharacterized protein YdhG (YjbR/CyaY superfamily)
MLVCLSSESRERVDEMVRKAVDAGGTTHDEPQDHGFMYEHGVQIWMPYLGTHLHGAKCTKSGLKGLPMKKVKPGAKKSASAQTVDDYLAALPEEKRDTLEKLRKAIKAAAPQATEVISYQMPMYKHHGMLVGFAAFKDHCSFFPGAKAIATHKDELKAYGTSKGTIRFPVGKLLPAALVKKLVKERIAENEKRLSEKLKKQ